METQTFVDSANQTAINDKETLTIAEIEDWLISHLAEHLEIDPDDIEVEGSFADYGINSSLAVSITDELSKWLNCECDATLLWDYPSIAAVSQYLAESKICN
jgi:acyl carrier protein